MPWRTTNVTLMDPAGLAAQLDNDTERLFGGRKGRKINPYPRLRVQESRPRRSTRKAKGEKVQREATQPASLPERTEIEPLHVYAIDAATAKVEDLARKILTRCATARVLLPQGDDSPVSGYLFAAFDHSPTEIELAQARQALHPAEGTRQAADASGRPKMLGVLEEGERQQTLRWCR